MSENCTHDCENCSANCPSREGEAPDFSIPVNLVTCLVSGVFGIPGVIFLVVVIFFFG